MKNKFILIYILILTVTSVSAQNLRRANHLFDNRAYVDAAELYLEESNKDAEVHAKLADCYYYNSNMSEAAAWYNNLITKFPGEYHIIYLYKYAQSLKGIRDFDEADKWLLKYNQKVVEGQFNLPKTKPFFKQLNSSIDRPFLVFEALNNNENSDFSPSYYGDKIVFTSTRLQEKLYDWNKQSYLDLYQASVNEEGDLTEIEVFSKELNTPSMHESHAVFTKDGKTMYFTRNNNKKGKKVRDRKKISHLKIYRATLVDGVWTNVEDLPFNGEDFSTEHPTLSADEKTLIFASDRPGGYGSFDLYKVVLMDNGKFSTPENLGEEINTKHREQFPFLSAKNNLYFSSDGHFGLGGLDVFRSEADYTTFKTPKNLSDKINSPLDDFGFIIDADEETGYFSSNKDGNGFDKIYRFEKLERYFVEGYVRDVNDGQLLEGARVDLKNADGEIIAETVVGADGFYSFEIQGNKEYSVTGSIQLYDSTTIEFETDVAGKTNRDILLQLISFEDAEETIVKEKGKVQIKIKNIYFEFNKWDLKPWNLPELDKIVAIMTKYPTMKLEVGAHCDIRGDDDFNVELSHLRAKSVLDYLTSKGIAADRLTSIGYGESQPINKCSRHGICTEEEYSANRRCEFVIIQ